MKSKVKICFINGTHTWSGRQTWHYDAACYFDEAEGYEVSAICARNSRFARKLEARGIPVHEGSFGKLSFLFPWKKRTMITHLKNISPDIVIMNGNANLKLLVAASILAGVRVRVYRRGIGTQVRITEKNIEYLGVGLTHILPQSKYAAQRYNKFTDHSILEKVLPFYNGVETDYFYHQAGNDKIIHIGIMSLFQQQQRLDHALGAMKILHRDNVVLHIAGMENEMKKVRSLSEKLGLKNKLQFHGYIDDIPEFLSKMNIYMHTAADDISGYAVMQAMAASLPVIAYRSGSIPEIVKNKETGLLCQDKNIPALASKLEILCREKYIREGMGNAGRQRACEHFDKTMQFKKLEKLLNESL